MNTKLLFTIAITLCFSIFANSQCQYNFYDTGGVAGNYSNNENSVVTYCPDIPGDVIYADFTSLSIEPFNDGLYVFDGNSTTDPQIMSTNPAGAIPGGLPGAFWGGLPPGPFISTSPDGCLTFQFRSNSTVTSAGWEALIYCAPIQECTSAPTNLAVFNVTDTSVGLAWQENGMGLSWQVIALPCGAPAPTDATQGIPVNGNPTVFTGLTPNQCYQLYVRTWCTPNDFSPWSGPVTTITTSPEPVCGGAYYDSAGSSQNYSDNEQQITTICPNAPGDVVTVNFTSFNIEAENDALYVYDGASIMAPQLSSGNPAGNVPGGLAGGFWGTDVPGPFTSTSAEGCLTFMFRSNGSVNASGWEANITCGMPNTDTIAMLAFLDTNGNGQHDDGESAFPYGSYEIGLNGNPLAIVGNASYIYYFSVPDPTGLYDLNFALNASIDTFYDSEVTYSDVSIVPGSGVNYFYFPIELTGPYNDVAVSILPSNSPQPGFTYPVLVHYQNFGTSTVSGTITFVKDPLLTITTITQPGTVPTAEGFTYDYTDLEPFGSRLFQVWMTVPTIPTVTLETVLTNSATITGGSDDIDPDNNSSSLSSLVVGSYDPNDITEAHGPQIVFAEFGSDEYLYYTIRFQNSGTANATTVRVENLLDEQLDANSISMVTASHNYNMTREGDQLTWVFDDIQLVPESVNSDASQGYVVYKIKPDPGYAIGDIITGIAEIYFDFNPAIITEPFTTEFVEQLGIADRTNEMIHLYPNPASSMLHVSNANNSSMDVTIYDMLGKALIRTENGNGHDTAIDVSQLSAGIYSVVISTSDNLKSVKKLIIK